MLRPTSFAYRVRRMGDKKPPPYKAAGERLRRRRTALQDAKRLEALKDIAKSVGVTVSSYLSYERGEYWPKGEKRRRLAKLMDWSEIELDHGPQMSATSDSPEVNRLIMAFGWLTDDERQALLRELEAKAVTNKAIAKQLGPRFTIASDATMLAVLKRGGDFPPGAKIKAKPPARRGPNAYREEDPE